MKKLNDMKDVNIYKILLLYNIVILILAVLFYYLIPVLLNYGPETINCYFETQIDAGYYYYVQFSVITLVIMLLDDLVVISQVKGLSNWKQLLSDSSDNIKKLNIIKHKCFKTPYILYLFQLFIFPIVIFIILSLTEAKPSLTAKIMSLSFIFAALISIITYIFTKNVFKKILIISNNQKMYYKRIRFTLKGKIFFQILPLFMGTAVFIGMFGYSALIEEKGEILFNEYYNLLSKEFIEKNYNIDDVLEKLKNVRELDDSANRFILKGYNEVYNEGEPLTDFFIKYTNIVASKYNGHAYDYYGSDIQGTVKYITIGNEPYIIGIIYNVASTKMLILMFSSIGFMLVISLIYLYYFSNDISKEIVEISKILSNIAEQTAIDFDQKLPVTSNDEIGELIIAFNKIIDLEKKNIEQKEKNQDIMVEQERLSSLGQLIGGIAHNLKTPIMSIAGVVEGMTDLIKEYDESIEDTSVTKQDHHEIAKDMQNWIDKVRPYLSYMTEVIDTVKGQAVSMNASTMTSFSAKELVARTHILLRDSLKRRHCNLNLDIDVDENSVIAGEISAIVQVLDNLVINAMDAYKDEGGDIDIKVREDATKVYIEVKDYGCGIPQKVQDKLFKEMITSKGKNGTGLGLYMSFSTIKGKFKGDIRFQTEEGKGTTFFIELLKYLG